jgi:hypothetical protein
VPLFCSCRLFLSKNLPLQNSEFKTDINTKGEAVFVADSVKSNPLAELFAKEGSLDSDSLKDYGQKTYSVAI